LADGVDHEIRYFMRTGNPVVDVTQSVITVSALSRRFGTKTALASGLVLARGAVYGLVGANGAGKDDAHQTLSGFVTSGERLGARLRP